MSDEKDFNILPTRDNNPAGKSNENRMLAKTGRLGNDSFIKDQRNIVGPAETLLPSVSVYLRRADVVVRV